MVGINLSGHTTLERAKPAASSCLRRTVRLAKSKRDTLTQYLITYPKYWEYPDRVFCWLHPEYKQYVDDFYGNNGPPLRKLLSQDEIDALDVECAKSLQSRLPKPPPIISDLHILSEFYRIKILLGRTPTLTEIGKHGKYSQRLWHKRFGAYNKFLDAIGETRSKVRANTTTKSDVSPAHSKPEVILINTYNQVRTKLGRPPKVTEMPIWNPGEFDKAVEMFGGWKEFIKAIEMCHRN